MNDRLRLFLPLAAACAAFGVSCGPNEQAQTVSFFLEIQSERLNEIEFVVSYADGKFAATDGQCVLSSAASPTSFATSEARLLAGDESRAASHRQRAVAVTSSTQTTQTTQTTLVGDAAPTGSVPDADDCGNGEIDDGEECDDNGTSSGDGCDGNCQAEFEFSAVDDDMGELRIHIVNGKGLVPGSTLVFCKFQGDIETAELGISTIGCSLASGGTCRPATDAIVDVSTTTTTTTTTTSTTSTTKAGDTTTTSTTEENP